MKTYKTMCLNCGITTEEKNIKEYKGFMLCQNCIETGLIPDRLKICENCRYSDMYELTGYCTVNRNFIKYDFSCENFGLKMV